MKRVRCLQNIPLEGLESLALSMFALRPQRVPGLGEPYMCSDGATVLIPNSDSVQCSNAVIDARVYGPDGVGFIGLMSESKRLMDWALSHQFEIFEASQPWARSATGAGFLVPVSMWARKVKFTFARTESAKGKSTHVKGIEHSRVLEALLKPRLIEQINSILFPEKLYVARAGEKGIDFLSNSESPFSLPATSCKCDKYLSQGVVFLEFAERSLSAEEKQNRQNWKPKA